MTTSLKNNKKYQILIRIGVGLIFIFILLTIFYFLFRQAILTHFSEKITKKILLQQNIQISYDQLQFKGTDIIYCEQLRCVRDQDTLLHIDTFTIDISLIHLMRLTPRIDRLMISKLCINSPQSENSEIKIDTTSGKIDTIISKLSISEKVYQWVQRANKYLPKEVEVNTLNFSSSITSQISFEKILISDGTIQVYYPGSALDDNATAFMIQGSYKKTIYIQMIPTASEEIRLPKLHFTDALSIRFDSASMLIETSEVESNHIELSISTYLKGFDCHYKKLGKDTFSIDSLSSFFDIKVENNLFTLTPSSYSKLNKLKIPFRLEWNKGEYFEMEVPSFTFNSEELFQSLPKGMFYSLPGLKSEGKLTYHLHFKFPFQKPEEIILSTALTQDQFKIIKLGNDNYYAANDTFWYSVYENGALMQKIFIGENNPHFHRYANISNYLSACVLTSEDGSFFYHKGFNEESIKASIIENYQKGRFARGGSTISMQWVKNMYLSRNKTISRKLEEMLIVWIIENERIIPKERMLEVYLNIIEWGKGVYGIGEASEFYFNKKPSELSLSESLYLSCIIPRPKYYQYVFESNGVTKPFYKDYCKKMLAFMLRKEWITPSDTIGLETNILLTGEAAQVFKKPDSIDIAAPEIFFEETP